jgi:pyruvate dehydrogenase E2 component (dihydrolipoamide acetyltransferase)
VTADVVMPALGMAQETGTLMRWLKHEGELVAKGEPLMEVETDKATVEIEAPASGTLSQVRANEGDVVPVGQVIALILTPGEEARAAPVPEKQTRNLEVSPLAQRIAEKQGVDLAQVKPSGGRILKEDVLSYLERSGLGQAVPAGSAAEEQKSGNGAAAQLIPASPKARRAAAERGIELRGLKGSGPGGVILAADIPAQSAATAAPAAQAERGAAQALPEPLPSGEIERVSSTWRIMANRMAASWTSAPHFYLMCEVRADKLVELRARVSPAVQRRGGIKPTYTDLLVKIVATVLRDHPRLNASWTGDSIQTHTDINIGLAVGIDDGLVVPIIHAADRMSLSEISAQRQDLSVRANEHRLRPEELAGGTFTISNLGMYNVDAFLAVLNPPQAAILAVGRIAERVVAENGQAVVRPMVTFGLSCDHRVADGLRAAKFLDDLALLVEEPMGLIV